MNTLYRNTFYQFATQPQPVDFETLARYVASSLPERLHPALWPQRAAVASELRRMAQQPHEQAARSAYHALRLFVW